MSLRGPAAPILSSSPLVAALLAGSAGCSTAPRMLSAPAELGPPPALETAETPLPRPRTLVWTGAADGRSAVTYVLDDQGEVTTELPGIRIAAANTEWTWQEVVVPLKTVACTGAARQAPGEGRGTVVRLVPADARHDVLPVVTAPTQDSENEIDHVARLLASVGPFLFVEESTYTYTCGVHGTTAVRFRVWNVEEGATLDLLSELPHRERLIAKAKTELEDDGLAEGNVDGVESTGGGSTGGGPGLDEEEAPPTITELLPKIGAHGRLEASALVSIPACYACTSGGWSSYTSSTPVPVDLPERIRRLGPAPAALQRFADQHPGLSIGGYSVFDSGHSG